MKWQLEEEQVLYRESLRGWAEKAADSSKVRDWLESGDPDDFERRLVGDGWLGVGTPEECGGQGGGLLELALTAEVLARQAAPSAAWLASVIAFPGLPAEMVEKVLAGEGFIALAVDSSLPVASSFGVRVDASGGLSGSVPRVRGADRARWLLVPAGAPGRQRLHLVDVGAAGVRVARHELLDQSRSLADVHLDGAQGEPLAASTEEVSDFLAEAALRAAVLVSADALGAMHRMLELAVEYSLQRHQFGVPIGSFQAVKHAAASILVAVEAARSIVYFAAASIDADEPDCAVHAAVAKAQVASSAVAASDAALTMHGAIGYTWEYDLQLLYKRTWLDERLFGGSAVWNDRIADSLALVPVAQLA